MAPSENAPPKGSTSSGPETGPETGSGSGPDRGAATGSGAADDRRADITWLSTSEAARHLGVSTRTLYRFIDEGKIPAYKFGRVIRLRLDEVEDFIGASRIEPGSLEHLYPGGDDT